MPLVFCLMQKHSKTPYRLHDGDRLVGWVSRDKTSPRMFRVILPDGQLSEKLKLKQAKDRAETIAGKPQNKFTWHH
jgi:hypothetical protein